MSSPSLKGSPKVDDWLAIEADGTVVIRTGKVEIGQRIGLAIARIAADELEVDASRVRVQPADTEHAPDEGYTSGSNSVHQSGIAVRLACATARRYLLRRAANIMGVPEDSEGGFGLRLEDGLVRAEGVNRVLRYEELLDGEPFGIAVDPDAPLKPSNEYRLVGASDLPLDPSLAPPIPDLLNGKETFVHDLDLPGMRHARVIRPPHYHARLVDWPAELHPPAGAHCVRRGSFVAVAARDEFTAIKAAGHLAARLNWHRDTELAAPDDMFAALKSFRRMSRPVVDGTPQDAPVPPPCSRPAGTVTQFATTYERPYQMHGSIGPSAAAALFEPPQLTVWSHTQGIFPLRGSLAEALDLAPEHIVVHHTRGAGCYGHNGADDVALDAALVALALPGQPVLLKWTREDEHGWEPFASCMAVDLEASVDASGRVLTWSHETFSDTHLGRPRPGPGTGGARLLAAQHGDPPLRPSPARPWMVNHAGLHRNADPIYCFDETRIVKHLVPDMPLRTSSMRTLGGFANVFAIESFMDELAIRTGTDPIEFRLRHLNDQRAAECLARLQSHLTNWSTATRQHRGRGVGFARYKNQMAYAAVGIEVEVGDDAQVRLCRAIVVGDTGQIIDPDGAAAQLEGGLLQAASWCLYEAVTFDSSGVTSRDWDSYPILRFDNVPDIEVELIPRQDQPPLGIGEASSGPAGAAIANAVYDACGLRLRRMPFTPDALRAAAMQDDDP